MTSTAPVVSPVTVLPQVISPDDSPGTVAVGGAEGSIEG